MQRHFFEFWHSLPKALARSQPYSWWLLWATLALGGCLAAFYYVNSFDYVPLRYLAFGLVPTPFVFLLLSWVVGQWIAPHLGGQPRRRLLYWLLVSLAVAGVIYWHYPPPRLALPAKHVLQIYTTGRQNAGASGSTIEIQKLRYLDGQRVRLKDLTLTGEWNEFDEDSLSTSGTTPASLELRGSMAGGVAIALRYNEVGGIARVVWDGVEQDLDTFSLYSTSFYTPFEAATLTPAAQAVTVIWHGLYLSALVFLALLAILILRLAAPQPGGQRLALAAAYLLVFVAFVWVKQYYHHFNDVRNLRDTYSYVATASQPLASAGFWLGERAFTIPLFFKLVGVNTQNYQEPAIMWRLAEFQAWFSVFAWTVLAGVAASKIRHPWIGVLGFTLVLFFSANQEISMWDTFLLSESLAFALFALLMALWLVTFDRWFPEEGTNAPGLRMKEIPWLLGMLVVTVLFSFTRDANLYLICVGSGVLFGLGGLMRGRRSMGPSKARLGLASVIHSFSPMALVYLGAVLVLFVAQPLIVNQSGRWQVHIYDHLGRRLLADPRAVEYLKGTGLPVTPELLSITRMTGPEYRAYLDTAPEMAAVREWVAAEGRSAYLGYLLAYPLDALLAPFSHLTSLLNGSSLEYRYPKYTVLPVPPRMQDLTEKYYPLDWPAVLMMMGLTALSLFAACQNGRPLPALGWLMLAFWVAVYPLMFIVWHGNPLEIERHAGQIGIMIRLAGWLAVPVLLDVVVERSAWRKFWQVDDATGDNPL